MQRCRYVVNYYDGGQNQTARFSVWEDAVYFAHKKSSRYMTDITLLARKGGGLVGQFRLGKIMPEFRGHLERFIPEFGIGA